MFEILEELNAFVDRNWFDYGGQCLFSNWSQKSPQDSTNLISILKLKKHCASFSSIGNHAFLLRTNIFLIHGVTNVPGLFCQWQKKKKNRYTIFFLCASSKSSIAFYWVLSSLENLVVRLIFIFKARVVGSRTQVNRFPNFAFDYVTFSFLIFVLISLTNTFQACKLLFFFHN